MDFSKKAPVSFWSDFPSRKLPTKLATRINIPVLKKLASKARNQFTIHQIEAADITIRNLTTGTPSYQASQLKGGLMRNASSAKAHGPAFTKVLAGWIEDGFVAGPFMSPPLPEFRANSIMVVEQKTKVRPILNMSYPDGDSYNDNVDELAVPKVRMSSPKQFGQSVLKAGTGALMSKMDMKDAYKNVPAKVEDLRLQGFSWLGAYFAETQLIFSASPAVANFDNLGGTTENITLTHCSIPEDLVHRILDDTVCVAPAGTGWCQEFSETYKRICHQLNIKLAEECPRQEKAFTNKTRGTILRIQFDTNKLAWRISEDKISEILSDIYTLIHGGNADLEQMERVAGRLNNFGQMCPFLQAFKRPLNNLLASFKEDYSILKEISVDLIRDLRVWAAVANYANRWMPIPTELTHPPMDAMIFISDAASGTGAEEWAGVASLGLTESDTFWFLCRGEWPEAILQRKDEKGANFSSKMTTLETVGLLLPLLTVPQTVKGKNIILGVDNISVVYGWENRSAKGDLSASVLIRALHLVACYLEARIFVQHVPRRSSLANIMADNFTRASTSNTEAWTTVAGAKQYPPPKPLWDWLEDPKTDWNLGFKLVNWLKSNS